MNVRATFTECNKATTITDSLDVKELSKSSVLDDEEVVNPINREDRSSPMTQKSHETRGPCGALGHDVVLTG